MFNPEREAYRAAVKPAGPAPTIITSYIIDTPPKIIYGVNEGIRTLDLRGHNPALSPTELHPPCFILMERTMGLEPTTSTLAT